MKQKIDNMKILVSSCIIGKNCKYNGGNSLNPAVLDFLKDKEMIEICPEVLAGLPIPRPSVELVNGVAMEKNGQCVHDEYQKGVQLAMKKVEAMDIDLVILQSRSPTCGVNEIYDGTFTGNLVEGQGLFAKALIEKGYKVKDVKDFN